MNLTPVHARPDRHELLWKLLSERSALESISHKEMPSFADHVKFVESRPYESWYFIMLLGVVIGACYLSKRDEIGVSLFKAWQGDGYGPQAVKLLMELHGPRRYLANINPQNARSIALFEKLGFKHIQNTYECVSGS